MYLAASTLHVPALISDLGLILVTAAIAVLLFRWLKQPLVLGYLVAGFLAGSQSEFFPTVKDVNSVNVWAEIGVIFLLFSLGLEFSFKKLMKVGGTASITALTQMICMVALGYYVGQLMDWGKMNSLFLGVIISVSSTTIILKTFDELGVKTKKFAGNVIGALIVWGITTLIPIIQEQTISIIENWPIYWDNIVSQIDSWLRSDVLSEFQTRLTDLNANLLSNVSDQANSVLDTTFTSIGSVVGALTNVVIAIITMPFILFYLLKDGKSLPYHVMKMIPSKMRGGTYRLLTEINTQISQYIRGQLMVAFFVGLMFWIGFASIGLEYAVTLGVLAGFLNLIPYLGSFLATVPAIVIALVDSPSMLIKVLIVFAIEQTIEGRVIQPQILGNNLEIHPLTIIIVLLSAGKIFGVPGVILGIPGYAILKVIVVHFFRWYKDYSGLYESDDNPAPSPLVVASKKEKD